MSGKRLLQISYIPKLSLQEFQVLGISNRRDMMNLRIKCSTFNSLAPKFDIPKEILSNLLDEDFTIKGISRLLVVSERTTYRRMNDFNMHKLNFTDISEEELDEMVLKLCVEFPKCVERMINHILRRIGIFIQRALLRYSISRVDPARVEERRKGRLHRRIYNVQGPNHLWHVDTNHKLI